MSNAAALLLILGTLPPFLLTLPFIWYAKRHGEAPQKYGIAILWAMMGWTVVVALWVLKADLDVALEVSAMAGVVGTLAIIGWRRALGVTFGPRKRR